MIGTHNSLTACEPIHWYFKPFKFLWRCQTKFLREQLEYGTKFVDIRVRINDKGEIVFCHGIVDLECSNLEYILIMLATYNATCRIIVERGNSLKIMDYIPFEYFDTVVKQVIIKKGWRVIYNRLENEIIDYSYVPFYSDKSFWWNIKHMKFSTIKKWAKQHNPKFNNDILKSNTIHFVDYF